MKGTYKDPKQRWNRRDLNHQHLTKAVGEKLECAVKKGDLMLIYWPGQKLDMGLQEAAEDGPHELSKAIPGTKDWPWGLTVAGHWWIRDLSSEMGTVTFSAVSPVFANRARSSPSPDRVR